MKARTYMLDGRPIPVLISDEALREWEGVRHINKGIYPDRPPDVDTPTTRGWVIHPGEPGYQSPTLKPLSPDGDGSDWSKPYESLVFDVPGELGVKFLSGTRDDDPGFIFTKVRFQQRDGSWRTEVEHRLPLDKWEEMKQAGIAANQKMGGKVMFTSQEDFAAMMGSYDEVEQAIAEWYQENGGSEYSKGIN